MLTILTAYVLPIGELNTRVTAAVEDLFSPPSESRTLIPGESRSLHPTRFLLFLTSIRLASLSGCEVSLA